MKTVAEKKHAGLRISKLRVKRYMKNEPNKKCNKVEYP
jgi:hypothetical protein